MILPIFDPLDKPRLFTYYHDMKPPSSSAFSLVELLSVIALFSIMAVAAVPAFQSIARGQDALAQSAMLRAYLQDARMSARAKGTWVRVGFHERTGQAGRREIVAVAISSMSGGSAGETDVADAVQWPLVGRPLVLRGATLDAAVGVGTFPSFQRKVGESTMEFGRVVEVSPSGIVRARAESLDRVIEFTISPDVGDSPPARLQVAGASGMMRVLR